MKRKGKNGESKKGRDEETVNYTVPGSNKITK